MNSDVNKDVSKNIKQVLETYKLGNIIGEGSYGDIINCEAKINDKNVSGVVKRIHNWDRRLTPFLETSIMVGVSHPNINGAISIFFNEKNMYILQERASCDLRTLIGSINKQITPDKPYSSFIPHEQRKKWCYDMASVIFSLHKINIIHADIKSSNVLVYDNNIIKLTDFGMSVKKIVPGEKFSHRVCTITHSAPEILQNIKWDESADIWSLGCLFHEIMYGGLPFPYQGFLKVDNTTTKDQKKTINKYRTLNCIESWAKLNNMSDITYTPRAVDFIKATWSTTRIKEFDSLLISMLQFNPKNRINIDGVLSHPFFKGYVNIKAQVHQPINNNIIHSQEVVFGKSKLANYKHTVLISEILKVYENLVMRSREYFDYLNTKSKDDYISWLYTCLWLANISIVNTAYFDMPPEYIKIIKSKLVPGVCEYLRFYILPLYNMSDTCQLN